MSTSTSTSTSTRATHHVTRIDLDSLGPVDASSPEAALERTIALTVLGTTGVHALGTPSARLVGAVRSRLGKGGVTGVTVTQASTGLQVDVALVAEYPTNVTELADKVRTQVGHAVGQLDGEPVSVDVSVVDVHGPFDDVAPADDASPDADDAEPRRGADNEESRVEDGAPADDPRSLGERASDLADSARTAIADAIDGTADAVDDASGEARDAAARDASARDPKAEPVTHDDAAAVEWERAADGHGDDGDRTGPVDAERDAADAAVDAAEAAARAAEAAADAARAAAAADDDARRA